MTGAISTAWRILGEQGFPLVVAPLLVGVLMSIVFVMGVLALVATSAFEVVRHLSTSNPEALARDIDRLTKSLPLAVGSLVWTLLVAMLDSFFRGGLTRMRLAAARGEEARFGDLWRGGSSFGSLLGLNLLVGIPGYLSLLIRVAAAATNSSGLVDVAQWVNGTSLVVLVLQPFGLVFAEAIVVDRGAGPLDAIKAALAAPGAARADVFITVLLAGVIGVSGIFCCGVPVLITGPLASLICTVVYTRITGTTGAQRLA